MSFALHSPLALKLMPPAKTTWEIGDIQVKTRVSS